jgi:outer membrane protein assembly factor BamB
MMFRTLWRRALHQRGTPGAVAVTPDHVVLHERRTRLVSVDPADGVTRWDVPLGTWPRAVVVDGTRCWAIPQDHDQLRCLDLVTGTTRWTVGLTPYTGHLVVVGDTVLVGGWRGYTTLRAFDRWDGTLRWESVAPMDSALPAAVGPHGVLVGQPGGTAVRLLDVRDGVETHRWTLPERLAAGDGQRPAFVAAGADRFLVRCGRHAVWQIRPRAGTAAEFFRHDGELAVDGISLTGGLVWAREAGSGYVAVDAATGRRLWRLDAGPAVVGDVVRSGSGLVVATARPGVLRLVDDDGTVREQVTVDQHIQGVRGLGPDALLVVGKGTLAAVGVNGSDPDRHSRQRPHQFRRRDV